MTNFTRNFIAGRMNKVVDQRLLPDGEYVDAMNIRMGSTENSEVGVIENTKGNLPLTSLSYTDGTPLSVNARCIGAMQDSANETLYWFVHDPDFSIGATGKLDLIVSYNISTNILTYHIISINNGDGVYTTLNFNPSYLITGINIIDDLLFWTDNYNQPRFINIKRNYANPVSNIDQFNPESILVIKKPPTSSPTVQVVATSGQENYLETRFICFAYRYKYADGEYSATSQWSAPAFIPNQFQFSIDTMLNQGMTNYGNTAIVNYNSGGPLVVGIDLLFKQSNSNIIKIIQKINKAESGFGDYQTQQFSFNNSKIFTILDESEILRLYDNVPRLAKAQTIMGNRLMYGNYIEGYDLIDFNGFPTKLDYTTTLITEPIGVETIDDSTWTGVYNIDPGSIGLSVTSSILTIDLAGKDLVEGSSISFTATINHSQFTPTTATPDQVTENVLISFSYLLTNSYSSVYALATSPEFLASVGTVANILPVYTSVVGVDTSCNGNTLTDKFNCAIPQNLGSTTSVNYQKFGSGINGILEPILIITMPSSTQIGFQFPAMKFVDNPSAPTVSLYEYYYISFASATFQKIANPTSLHSNRGYEVGIVYMDEFNRATTALVSSNNTEFVPCGYSANKNSIQVVIPPSQRAPKWAKKYRFVIKPDAENYETIYSNLFFKDPVLSSYWFLLEGQNMRKVEVGDELIVKSDASGATQNCIYVTVLEKTAQAEGFIQIPTKTDPTKFIFVPAGLYIKINANQIDLSQEENAFIAPGKKTNYEFQDPNYLAYPVNIEGTDPTHPTWDYIDYSIPAGSRIVFDLTFYRRGNNQSGYIFKKSYVSSKYYDNFYNWFIGDNIELTINSGTMAANPQSNKFVPRTDVPLSYITTGTTTSSAANKLIDSTATFLSDGIIAGARVLITSFPNRLATVTNVDSETQLTLDTNIAATSPLNYEISYNTPDTIFWQFYRNATTNQLTLQFGMSDQGIGTTIEAIIDVYRAESLIVFETKPSDALPDVFFENELSFDIDSFGNHEGNVQNQNISSNIPAIINTEFFNCYAFGNGVESYKIQDSIVGRPFNFGQRVTTVANQDYKMANRFSDITYSGIYNGESNINNLNQFNSGLSNFKHCEASFGPIQLLDGRNTDVLVLQEDKISYVLAEKNLLSDASAGGVITASPAVLGTQIARTEKYGISFNPESYIQWGYDRYFTDVKRGTVIQLKGGDSQNEQLVVVSDQNMRTWFRDTFNQSFNTQKLGGFDPYMNEYVLVINEQLLPSNPQCLNCGINQTFTLSINNEVSKQETYCVDLGSLVGVTEVIWVFTSIQAGATLNISVDYDGDVVDSGDISSDGNLFFDKNNVSVETASITLTYTGDMVVSVLANCCLTETLNIVEVVLTNNSEAGSTIHTQYRYTNGSFVSPLLSNLVLFQSGTASPLVSRYNITSGFAGSGGFPPQLSTMRLFTNQISPDDFVFNPANDKFKYLRTFTLYENNDADMQSMVSASTIATPIFGDNPIYYAEFTVPESSNGDYLYLIWDLRDAIATELCYALTVIDACCDCTPDTYYLNTNFNEATSIYTDNTLSTFADNGFYSLDGVVRELIDGVLQPQQKCRPCAVAASLCFGFSVSDVTCDCDNTCLTPYNTYEATNTSASYAVVGFYNQDGIYVEETIAPSDTKEYCSIGMPTSSNAFVYITFVSCGCV